MPGKKSLCKGKSVKNPNRCKKMRGCKVAKGPKRTFCRKKRNRPRTKGNRPRTKSSSRSAAATRKAQKHDRIINKLKAIHATNPERLYSRWHNPHNYA